jgi:capsular exopolysaccharide synthesis family protein
MNLQDFLKLLRTRWVTIAIATALGVLAAVAYTLISTPLYQASTRLFVSTTVGRSAAELYQGNRLSQDRVLSYTELLTGETLAQRTVDKMDLDMSARQLKAKIKATAKVDTVLIDVSVLDASPVRARDIANALSEEFVVMVRELETPSPGASPDARVVVEQKASIPEKPSFPKPSRNILGGLAGGLLLGVGLAVLRDRLDNTVKTRETLEEITSVGLVGSIPVDKECRNDPAISFENNNSAIAEAFRKLRTNLQFLAVDNPPRLIVVTSSVPSEGKSTSAINIALALAEAEYKVALIDGDLRRPSLDKYMGLVGAVGFSTVLSGGAALDDVLQETKFPNLTVMTAGTSPPNPSELLSSLSAKKVLEELRQRFDYVIIDSPPILAVTDGAILAAKSDGALIMARYGSTKREQLAHSVGTLDDVGATLLGAVFTITPMRGHSSYHYSYNYSYYGEERSGTKAESAASKIKGGASTAATANGVDVDVEASRDLSKHGDQ